MVYKESLCYLLCSFTDPAFGRHLVLDQNDFGQSDCMMTKKPSERFFACCYRSIEIKS